MNAIVKGQFKLGSVTALLNDSAWYGKAHTSRRSWKVKKHKKSNWFDVSFLTNIPHSKYSFTLDYTSHQAAFDTSINWIPTQWLSFNNVPLAVGMYKLFNSSSRQDPVVEARYDLLEGGDAISDSYHLKKDDNNWIQIIKYSSITGIVVGRFELKLMSQSGKTAHFRRGSFKAKIVAED
jgi:hypothetical protein